MKVILQKDIRRVGKKFEVKDVPSGHALNYLIPHKLAVPATGNALKKLQDMEEAVRAEHEAKESAFEALIEKIGNASVTVSAKESDKGNLYEAVHGEDIASAIKDAVDADVESHMIEIPNPIKQTGEHTVLLIQGDRKQQITINVVGA